MIRIIWQKVLEILFPPICLNCRSHLLTMEEKEDLLCAACFQGIKIYSNIFRFDPRFSLIAVGSYENSALRELIHYLKYSGFLGAKAPLEKLIIKWLNTNSSLASSILDSSFCLVPIPLHQSRFRKRGFNQAELIAEILSRLLRCPLEKDLLERVRNAKPQIEMKSARERSRNIKNSIRVKSGKEIILSKYPNLILVDDVYTSGSTMKEAMRVLRRSGAKNITAFVIAKT